MSARQPHELLLAAQHVDIAGTQLSPIEYEGVRVLTLAMIDQAHQRPDGTARRNFNEHRARLVIGEDFYELNQPNEIRTLGFSRPQGGTPATVMLLTETGYSMLVKSFNDDLAWDVQRQLVKSYFAKPAPAADPLANLPPEQRALIALMVEQAAIKDAQVQLANVQATQQESIKRIEAKQSAIENGVSYFTVIGYGSYKGIKFSNSDAAAMGRKASALSKAAGIPTEKVRDPRFGEVGSYHESMLDQALTALYGGM